VLPLPPEVNTIQELVLVGIQAQSLSVITSIDPPPPEGPRAALRGSMLNRHVAGLRTCVTVTVVKPTVIEPERARPLFGATLNPTEPGPPPLAPEVIVIHDAFAEDVHEQSLSVDTLIETLAPVKLTEAPCGLSV
jgi:hypothetical protein